MKGAVHVLPPVVESCGTCRFLVKQLSHGECHRYPAMVFVNGDQIASHYPPTRSELWCGEWQREVAGGAWRRGSTEGTA